ncbi:MAG: aminoglycoside phosphotransferase family protein [Eubacteriales bacterium]|nr:aminoglycoside phosphotransferase family protein [Eubacteriales bacterium]
MLNLTGLFAIPGSVEKVEPYGNGHINQTYLVTADCGRYILQRINDSIFTDVDGLMHNIHAVTEYLAASDPDPRHVLRIVPARDGGTYIRNDKGCWRLYNFIENSLCLEKVGTAQDFETSAFAFGDFQRRLKQFPASTLTETIARFHDTPDRYRIFREALEKDPLGRAKDVQPEIEFALEREKDAGIMMGMLKKGELPLRVTHNDTKLNNVLLDAETRQPLCVIDLDTVMPGLAGNDFGDSIRFGATTGAEDERDLSKVNFSMPFYEAYARGFLRGCGADLTPAELQTLPMGAKLMTLECGVRFLTDHILGDTYFRIHRENHNLDRCRTQFKLVQDMEGRMDDMLQVISRLSGRI